MRKSLLLAALLVFSSLLFAAKSYHVTITAPTKVGSQQLAKGSYTLHLEGDKAVFKDDANHTVSVPVKLDNGSKKFSYTSVESAEKNGQNAVTAIHLEGSTTTLEFGD